MERLPIVVIGSGAAGSSLVRALVAADVPGPLLLLDAVAHPHADRSWAFWSVHGDRDAAACGRALRRLRVAGDSIDVVLPMRPYEYRVVRATDLWRVTDEALARGGGRRLRTRASGISPGTESVTVETAEGPIPARWAFDSLGLLPATAPSAPHAWLEFTGWEVQCQDSVLDPEVPTFMDFRVEQHGEASFIHVLPSSATRALVELTRFTARPGGVPGAGRATTDLADYVDRLAGADRWYVTRREHGRLPLHDGRMHRRKGRAMTIGTPAGLVKASTGYGYRFMRDDATSIARDLAGGRVPQGLPRAGHHRAMDATFLRVALNEPERLVAALESMFAANRLDLVLSFLDETTSLAQEARLTTTLPVAPFVRGALHLPPPQQ